MSKSLVGIIMGSKSDVETMKKAEAILDKFGVPYETKVMSAHRTPDQVADYTRNAEKNGIKVLITGAGLAAALPGVVAAHTTLPVIGVPMAGGPLAGQDALYSIVQMPKGIPVATVGIGNATNAALLAVAVLAIEDTGLNKKLKDYRQEIASN